MKPDQQQQAQHLYFQTDLNKTEIANAIGISRSTLHLWIRQNNWERLKKSAEFIPAFLAENCYQVLGNYTEYLLSAEHRNEPVTTQEVNNLYKLTLTINKLKNRSTLCERMEMAQWFTEKVHDKDPVLAQKMQPHLQEYIGSQAGNDHKQYGPAKMQGLSYIPYKDPIKTNMETKMDEEDFHTWAAKQNASQPQATPASPSAPVAESSPAPLHTTVPPAVTKTPAQAHDLRKMLRGTATTGPARVLRRNQPVAA